MCSQTIGISENEIIIDYLDSLRDKWSAGPDGVPSLFLKCVDMRQAFTLFI